MLLDLLLPDLSGVAGGRAPRDAASTHDLPIVISSGDRTPFARSKPEISADWFLEKPFSHAAVQSAVRAVLGPDTGTPGAA